MPLCLRKLWRRSKQHHLWAAAAIKMKRFRQFLLLEDAVPRPPDSYSITLVTQCWSAPSYMAFRNRLFFQCLANSAPDHQQRTKVLCMTAMLKDLRVLYFEYAFLAPCPVYWDTQLINELTRDTSVAPRWLSGILIQCFEFWEAKCFRQPMHALETIEQHAFRGPSQLYKYIQFSMQSNLTLAQNREYPVSYINNRVTVDWE